MCLSAELLGLGRGVRCRRLWEALEDFTNPTTCMSLHIHTPLAGLHLSMFISTAVLGEQKPPEPRSPQLCSAWGLHLWEESESALGEK